jgi:hypothetical protein
MHGPNESGVHIRLAGEAGTWRIMHDMIDAASVVLASVEEILKGTCKTDETLVHETRRALDRLVSLAREAQELRRETEGVPAIR